MQNLNELNITKTNDGVTFKVKVIPNSSASKISEITNEYIKIKLNSPPIENRANKEVIVMLSKVLGIPKTSIKILSGEKNKLKTFQVPLTEEQLRIKIAESIE